MSKKVILEIENIRKSYLDNNVLNDYCLKVDEGEIIALLGPSGCGKTTLLRCLCGFEEIDSGHIKLTGKDCANIPPESRNIGMVFQSYYLVPELRALDNVMLGGRISGRIEKLEKRSVELLERVGLGDRMKSLPSTLSGGERQRVAIARAMISNPRILLADEPTGNLDETTGDSIMNMLQLMCREDSVALVLVTHNTTYASRMDDSWLLKQGILELS